MNNPAIQKAILAVGSARALARRLGISQAAISQWRKVPALRVLAVEAATEGRVSRHELRPDLYPTEPHSHDAARQN